MSGEGIDGMVQFYLLRFPQVTSGGTSLSMHALNKHHSRHLGGKQM